MRAITGASVVYGWRNRSLKLMIMVSFLQLGLLSWAFYVWQPYFLGLLDQKMGWLARVVGVALALATMMGNGLVEWLARFCGRRTTLLLVGLDHPGRGRRSGRLYRISRDSNRSPGPVHGHDRSGGTREAPSNTRPSRASNGPRLSPLMRCSGTPEARSAKSGSATSPKRVRSPEATSVVAWR
ncbi:MAG: hypothetical protein ACREA0_12810 [bacterium]